MPVDFRKRDPCPDCGVRPGELHVPGCDCEPCPRCGHQMIGCHCVYEVNGIDWMDLEEDHPDLWESGPTEAMYAAWDAAWAARRIPWSGEWPGDAECREYGFWCRWVEGTGWVQCGPNDHAATADLTRLHQLGTWDADAARWVVPPESRA